MDKYEIVIDRKRCKGCDYCVGFCPNNCMSRPGDVATAWGGASAKLGSGFGSGVGYAAPVVAHPERCIGCGTCAWMCPHWAIQVYRCIDATNKEKVAGPPKLLEDPPLGGCPGCQHPTAGRLVAEVLDEMGLSDKAIAFDSIPCSMSSAFGWDFGRKVTYGENSLDLATAARQKSPDVPVLVVQGYWGMSDFSFDINALTNTLVRGEKITVVLCTMPFYSPVYGQILGAPAGRLEPITSISTDGGNRIITGGSPPRLAELAASYNSTAYSARGTITSAKDYQITKSYIRNALRKQMDGAGFSLVEILMTCTDSSFSAPTECLKWVKDTMSKEFPTGEFRNTQV